MKAGWKALHISGGGFSPDYDNRLNLKLQNFNIDERPAEPSQPSGIHEKPAAGHDDIKTAENDAQGAFLSISESSSAAAAAVHNQGQTAVSHAPVNFSTGDGDSSKAYAADNNQNGNRVLEQYRFFVRTARHESNDGIVKRIFG